MIDFLFVGGCWVGAGVRNRYRGCSIVGGCGAAGGGDGGLRAAFSESDLISYFIGMEVEFRTTVDDYLAFYKYFYFWRKLWLRILFVALFSLVIASGMREGHSDFSWGSLLIFVVTAVLISVFVFVIPYIQAIRKTRKILEAPGQPDQKRAILSADGITVKDEDEAGTVIASGSWRWESVRLVDSNDRFVFIMLFNWKVFLIPRQYFQADDEVDNFIGIVRNAKARVRSGGLESDEAKARRIAPWGLLGLLPNFGAIAGIVLLYQGIIRLKSRLLVIIGVADILFTILFWTAMRHWVFDSPSMVRMEKQLSQTQLNTIFKNVEFYKIQHGDYPDSLQQIEDLKNDLWLSDALPRKGSRLKPGHYYYEKTGDKYWLFSVGKDGEPFTADDVYPTMNPADSTKFGLRLP
jgi:hypothetical protein